MALPDFISDEEMAQMEGSAMPDFISDDEMNQISPPPLLNAEGNTYQEAMYGDAAPAGMKLASGALDLFAYTADLPEILAGLNYKYNPLSPGFLKPTIQETLLQYKDSLKASGELGKFNPEAVAALDEGIKESGTPVLGLGDKLRAAFDYATGIENSTEVAPDSAWHLAGELAPGFLNPSTLLTKSVPTLAKSAAKTLAQTSLATGMGYGGREIDKKLGGSGALGEAAGALASVITPWGIKKLTKAGVESLDNLILGYDKAAPQKPYGGIDAAGNHTFDPQKIVKEVTKKDVLVQDLREIGFLDEISPLDTHRGVSRKLGKFIDSTGQRIKLTADDVAKLEVGAKLKPIKPSFPEAAAYIREQAKLDPALAERLGRKIADFKRGLRKNGKTVAGVNDLRATFGEQAKKSFQPGKMTDSLPDELNRAIYSDFRKMIDDRVDELAQFGKKPDLLSEFKRENKAITAGLTFRESTFNASRHSGLEKLGSVIASPRNLFRAGSIASGNPLLQTAAALDIARSMAPVQARATLKGVGAVADIFDPLTRLTAGGVAGSKVAGGSGKYIATPGAKMQPFVPLRVNPGTAPDVFNASEFSKTMINPKTGKGVILDSQIPILEGPSSSPLVSIRNKQQGIVPGEKPFSARTIEEQAIAEGQRAAAKEEFDFAKEVFDYRNRRVQLPGGPKPTFDPPMADPKGKFLTKGETSAKKDVEGLSRYEASVAKKESSVFFKKQLESSEASKKAKSADSIAKNIETAVSEAIGPKPKSKSAGRVRYEEKRKAVLDVFAEDLRRAAEGTKGSISKTRMANIDAAIEEARYGGKPVEAPVEAKAAPTDLPAFSVGKEERVAVATKAKADVASGVRGLVDEVMTKYSNESFNEPLGENDFIEASYGVGSGTKGALADEAGDYLGKGKPYQPAALEFGWKAKSERAKLLEFLPRQDYVEGRIFSDTEAQALVTAESSVDGLSFKSGNGKKFRPTDKATADFLGAFDNRKELSQEQVVRLAAGLKTPIKVNGVDISPHSRVPKNPEGGMTTGKAALALTAAGAIGMGVMNGGSLEEVALTPENKASERLVEAMIKQESGGKAKAVSPKGASGLMQLMPATAKEVAREMGLKDVDIFDPETNKKLGTYYINKMLKIYKNDPKLALAAYNAGPGNVRRWIAKWGMDWDKISSELEKRGQYMETVKYVPSIIKKMGVK